MGFEWDEPNNEENRKKHHVSFEEAQEAFMDPDRILLEDPKHSTADERRLYVLASVAGRVMTVRFTMRGESIRIIGAGYWRRGRKLYERQKNQDG